MPAPVTVDFYFSPTSPFAWLASTQLMRLQVETGCRIDWYPVSGRLLIAAAGFDPAKAAPHSGQYQPEYRRTDLQRWARLYEQPYRPHGDVVMPDPVRLVLACITAGRFDAGQVFARALMKAIFVDGTSPADDALCLRIAQDIAGIEPHLFQPMLDDPQTAAIHAELMEKARAAGCFGVPAFVIHDGSGGHQMVWGNDRLPLVAQAVREVRAGKPAAGP
jgi:2-hydroxychromene-2-carboxylate isomerase